MNPDTISKKFITIQNQIATMSLAMASMQAHINCLEQAVVSLRDQLELGPDDSSSGNDSSDDDVESPAQQDACQPFVMIPRHFLNINYESEESDTENELEEI